MNHLLTSLSHHGYALILVAVLAESLGLPAPAALALIAGGAAVASGTLSPLPMLATAFTGMLIGDTFLFILGRYTGWGLLSFLCKVSANPESCVMRSAESFYKRGKLTLVIAKFIPGINSIAPPLAGSMKMRPTLFLQLDMAGAALYIGVYTFAGFLFHDFLAGITRGVQAASHAVTIALIAAAIGYVIYKAIGYKKNRVYRIVPRVQVQELAEKIASDHKDDLILMDVRSHGYYDADAKRMKGSLRLEPNHLSEELKHLPLDKDIYLYCTCAKDATSAQVAHVLREKGFNAFVIQGGLGAWRRAGLPMEPVPIDDLVKLPTFS